MACRLSQDIRSEPDLGTVKELSEVNTDGAKILVSIGMSGVLHLKMYRETHSLAWFLTLVAIGLATV